MTAAQVLTWEFRVDPQEWWQVYRSSVGSSGAVLASAYPGGVSGGKAGNMAVTCSASISSRAGAGSKWPIDTKVPNACIVAAIDWVDAV